MVKINLEPISKFVSTSLLDKYIESANKGFATLLGANGEGNDFLGWLHLPSEIDKQLINDCNLVVKRWIGKVDAVVVVGIGGSYLGAKCVIEALSHSFAAQMPGVYPKIVYAGHNISQDYTAELLEYLGTRSYAIVVISKSGTTTEPALAFRILKEQLENKIGKDLASERIVAITDAKRGALRTLATKEKYTTFIIPDNIGGRFSVLTPVGLLPIALAGFDIEALVAGARDMEQMCATADLRLKDRENPAIMYAAARNALY